jgi:hypothetical protein
MPSRATPVGVGERSAISSVAAARTDWSLVIGASKGRGFEAGCFLIIRKSAAEANPKAGRRGCNAGLKVAQALRQSAVMHGTLMKTQGLTKMVAGLVLAGLLGWHTGALGAPRAEVRGLLGQAQFSRGGAAFVPVGKGVGFEAGDVIQTANGSAIDIDFGGMVGIVRLTESTAVVIERWTTAEGASELQLFVIDGEVLGKASRGAAGSRFLVKVNTGISAIVEGQYRVSAKGYVVLLDGKAVFAHVPAGGEAQAHSLNAPPAVYFSTAEGVRPAPEPLVKEVSNQWRSKLPKR